MRSSNGLEVLPLSPSEMHFAHERLTCQVPPMPPKKLPSAAKSATHKTTIVLPTDLHQDLRLLVALEPEGTIQALVERAVRELVQRERSTLEKLRQIKTEREERRLP